jgi:purine-binding chemotaxis protein CheW
MANIVKKTEEDKMKFAVFSIGAVDFALDIMRIKEIVKPLKITTIPKAPRFIEGVINLRGNIIPIVDLRKRFGVKIPESPLSSERIIIAKLNGKIIGLIVDLVTNVLSLGKSDISPPPEIVKGISSQFIKGLGKVGSRLILLIDLDRILTVSERISLKSSSSDSVHQTQDAEGE